jgi:hypothetical protein
MFTEIDKKQQNEKPSKVLSRSSILGLSLLKFTVVSTSFPTTYAIFHYKIKL